MKKYTIKDNLGNKKTIYARDLAHALKLNDNLDDDIYKALVEVSKNKNTHSSFGWNGIIEGMVENILINKGIIKKEDRLKVRKQIQQQMKASRVQKLFRDSIKDSYVEVPLVLNRFEINAIQKNWFDIKETGKKEDGHPVYRLTGNKEKLLRWLRNNYDRSFSSSDIHDAIKDEANLPTTIQALVNDEEAAIKAYEVAIKNLEGKIDETQMQVLINIMKDERRHVENLYAILNGQVTEKNLEDSVHDAFIVKADNEYIMEGDRAEMTSLKKYAKVFSSKQEAIDYARKYFRLRPIDIEIIEE